MASFRDNESRNHRTQKQISLAVKQKKFVLGKLLSAKIIPSNIQSLKYPIGPDSATKVESNSIEAVKNLVSQKKNKLYRSKKK